MVITWVRFLPLAMIISPLLGWGVLTVFRPYLSRKAAAIIANCTVGFSAICVALSIKTVVGNHPLNNVLYDWISIPGFSLSFGLSLDRLSLLMAAMVTGVGFLVHLYSIGYMSHESQSNRYFGHLNLFIFFMLVLVMSDNMVGTFIGWEGVGLCSYLLIGFWNTRPAYLKAASKAFVMNRIGDVGFVIAMAIILLNFGTLNYHEIIHQLPYLQLSSMTLFSIGSALVLAISGKSAQFPLYTWLPDAMAGPTPVSALIHAATMVTSGVYLVNRMHPLFNSSPQSLQLLLIVGILTTLIGGVTATFQTDLKKILAYSTVSQLGFMVIALGLGCYQVALFHMLTHAFFKALLFLSAGNIIHGLDGEQDIRKMGGVRKLLPVTGLLMGIGTLSIIGLPPLSGFFSKEAIFSAAMSQSPVAFGALILGSCLTVFYMARMVYFVFFGTYRGNVGHPHEGSISMQLALVTLAAFSIMGGLFGSIFHLPEPHQTELLLPAITIGIICIFGTAGILWARAQSRRTVTADRPLLGLDAIYDQFIVAPYLYTSRILINTIDRRLNQSIVGMGQMTQRIGALSIRIQTGNVGTYVVLMLLAIVALFLKVVIR